MGAFLLLERVDFLFQPVLALADTPLLIAHLRPNLLDLAVQLLAAAVQIVLGLEIGFLADLFGFFPSLSALGIPLAACCSGGASDRGSRASK